MSNIIIDTEKQLGAVKGSFSSIPEVQTRAQDELVFWNNRKESDPAVYPRLKEYWEYVNFGDGWTPSGTAWSSAFVSYLLRGQEFPKKSAHRLYIQDIIDKKNPSWSAFSIPKTDNLQLHVGDVLIKPRSGSYGNSHGDVVYKIEKGQAFLIGGNLGDTARTTEIFKVDQNGFVLEDVSPYLIILKKKGMKIDTKIFLIPIALGSILFLKRNMKK